MRELRKLCGKWKPNQTNAFELYLKAGSDWKKIDCSKIKEKTDWHKTWKDMPQEAIDYLKDLPEFDAEDFKTVTGIDVTDDSEDIEIDGKKFSKETIKQALKDYIN